MKAKIEKKDKRIKTEKKVAIPALKDVDNTINAWLANLDYAVLSNKEMETRTALYDQLQPKDPIEAMLISQIKAMHELTMLNHVRANHERSNAFVTRPAFTQASAKLSGAFIKLVESLNNYRGKHKTQYIRVEQVKVENGANAIVGNVNLQGGGIKK